MEPKDVSLAGQTKVIELESYNVLSGQVFQTETVEIHIKEKTIQSSVMTFET